MQYYFQTCQPFFLMQLTFKMNLIKMQIKLIFLVLMIKKNILFYQ